MTLNLSASPHVRDKWTTSFIMHTVFVSLLPAAVIGVLVNGWNAFFVILASILAAVVTEALFCLLTKRPLSILDGSAAVTGMLLALSLSPSTPVVYPVIGSVFAILVVKCCFGGLGKNFINPALAGRCFLLLSFGKVMTQFPALDGVTSATPLAVLSDAMTNGTPASLNVTSMFLGTSTGVIGSSIIALLIGGLVLWGLDIIHGEICFSVLIGFTLFMGIFGGKGFDVNYLLAHLCGGGVVMGAFFMATDYVTSPVSKLGQFIYGCLIGVLGGLFRLKGNTADSFSYAIIIGNVCTPLIDTYIVQKPFAYRKVGKTRKASKEPFRIPKPVIALTLIAAIAGVALSGVFSVTKDKIEEQEVFKQSVAYREVCPEATSFSYDDKAQEILGDEGTETENATIYACYVGKNAQNDLVGYALSVGAKGFGGQVIMALGLTPEGKITGINFTELKETAGLGMRADEPEFKDQFPGKSVSVDLVKGAPQDDNDISAITGATVTSTAVHNAVNAGLNFYETVLKGGN